MTSQPQRAAATEAGMTANGGQADTPDVLCDLARRMLSEGRLGEAELCCRQVLASDAGHADARHLMGRICVQSGQFTDAIAWLAGAIGKDPKAAYVSALGTALWRAGRLDEALKAFEKAIALQPDCAEHWTGLGAVLVDLKRAEDALLSFRHALRLDPRHVNAENWCGLVLYRAERFAEALAHFDRSVALDPNQADALHMRALALQKLGRLEEAAADGFTSRALDPANADTHNNLGTVLHQLGRYDEALTCFERAIALRPRFALALNNKGHLLADLLRCEQALEAYGQARAIAPDDPITVWNMAMLHMVMGDFEAGWAGREIRWKTGLGMADPNFAQPLWLGDRPIDGKTILLFADEGIGDSLQFARYVPMVAARGAKVILAVADPVRTLLARMPGIAACIPKSTVVLPAFDVHCSTSSLPLAFGTTLATIPATVPYLPAPLPARRQAWERRLGPHDRLRVGLVWSGNPGYHNDRNRSLPLSALADLLTVDATFVSLQKDPRAADRQTLAGLDIVDLADGLADFEETAALACCLDLVITVDTSVAHLAGGLGLPVWVLLPYRPDYRWLLDRDDSPWYPTARLFRQSADRQWAGVVERVRYALDALTREWRRGHNS